MAARGRNLCQHCTGGLIGALAERFLKTCPVGLLSPSEGVSPKLCEPRTMNLSFFDRIKAALWRITNAATTWLVGRGLPVPEIALARLPEFSRLKKVLREQQINCLLDVGANRGQFALMVRRLGYRGPIHSFEPQREVYRKLEKRSMADPDWHCYPLALGESSNEEVIGANQKHSEMTSLYPVSEAYGAVKPEPIQIKPLDLVFEDILAGINAPRVFLKIDTEGYDLAVIRGAAQSLPLIKVLQTEVFVRPIYQGAPHYLEVLAEIEAAGFQLEHIAVESLTYRDKLMCLNALFVRMG